MFGLFPWWKVLLGAVLQVVPFAGGLYAYDKVRLSGWKKPAAAAGVYGLLQLGVSYLNLSLLTPSLGDIASSVENWADGPTGSMYLPRGGGLPQSMPLHRGGGVGSMYLPHDGGLPRNMIGLVDARMARAI